MSRLAKKKAPSRPGRRRRPGRPRKGDGGAPARERLLDEAERQFAAQGFDGTSLASIAKAAGVDQALVHYHFGDKLGLWKAAVGQTFEVFDRYFEDFIADLEALDPVDMLRLSSRRYVRFMLTHPEMARLVVLETTRVSERTQWLLETHILPNYEVFAKLVERAQRAGVIRPMPPTEAVDFMNGATAFVALSSRLTNDLLAPEEERADFDDPKVVEQLADRIVDLILHGLRTN